MPNNLSPRRLRDMRAAVAAFRDSYVRYREVTLGANPNDQEAEQLRTRLNSLMAQAQEGLSAAHIDLTVHPPQATGGPPYSGLRNVAFLHERPGWRRAGVTQRVRDMLEIAVAELDHRAEHEARRRRNPFYWVDRVLRAVLGFPAYLLSLILGVPVARIESSPWSVLLRVVEMAATGLGIFFGGRSAAWW